MKLPDIVVREMVHGAEKVIALSPFSGESLWRGMEVLKMAKQHKEMVNGFQPNAGVSVGSVHFLDFASAFKGEGSALSDRTLKVGAQRFSAPAENLDLSLGQHNQSLLSRMKGETSLISLDRRFFS